MITSIQNPKIKDLLKLEKSKERKSTKSFIVEGAHLVLEARKKGLLIEAFSIEDKPGYTQVSDNVMRKLCHTDTIVSEIGLCKMIEDNKLSDKILICSSSNSVVDSISLELLNLQERVNDFQLLRIYAKNQEIIKRSRNLPKCFLLFYENLFHLIFYFF